MSKNAAATGNLGQRERAQRRVGAIAFGLIGLGAAIYLVATGSPPAWRALVFVPFFVAALSYFQAAEST